ncbi:MAG: hypothetical protein PHS30_01350 [Bacteroidales bacterium]|nr:hypothetical protein [Bacteroidales bacterium]
MVGSIYPCDFEDVLTTDGIVEAVHSSTVASARNIEGKIVYIVEDGAMVKEGEEVCVIENRELETSYDDMLLEVESAKGNLDKAKAELEMKTALLDAELKNFMAQTAIANLDSLQLKYLSPVQRRIKELELKKSALEMKKLQRKQNALKNINKSQLRSQEAQLRRKESRAKSILESLDMLSLRATHSGMALRAISWYSGEKLQVGDQVWSGMTVVNIPDISEMKVSMKAPEVSYKRMNVNDLVEFSFDAMPGNHAWGKILKKAPIGQPFKKDSKVMFFDMEASMDSSQTLPKPGLTVVCKVILQRLRDTIVVPQIAIFEEDSLKFVYVKRTEGYERRQVLTGVSSPKKAVIAAGLTGKERLSLIKPSSGDVTLKTLLPAKTKGKATASRPQQNKSPKIKNKQPNKVHSK